MIYTDGRPTVAWAKGRPRPNVSSRVERDREQFRIEECKRLLAQRTQRASLDTLS